MLRSCILSLVLFFVFVESTGIAQTAEVTFSISLATPVAEGDSLYLAGNTTALGQWNPRGLALTRKDNQLFEASVFCEAGELIEFKVTKGTWTTVEKAIGGGEIANRTAIAKPGLVVKATVESWSKPANPPSDSTAVGTLRIHRLTSITPHRLLRVWLPSGYDESVDRYPVLYMLDGQNVFDRISSAVGQEWGVDETLTKLISSHAIRPVIVVAIDNSSTRLNEYSPFPAPAKGQSQPTGAATFAQWIIQTLKPQIDREYRTIATRESTWIAGSSLGGLFSLYAVIEHNETFGGAMAMSPSLQWANEGIFDWLESPHRKISLPTRLWIDFGDQEGSNEIRAAENIARFNRATALLAAINNTSVSGKSLQVGGRVFPGAKHSESAWAERFGEAMLFLAE